MKIYEHLPKTGTNIKERNERDITCLMKASISGNIELDKYIKEDVVESETKHYGLNALFFAEANGT